MHCPSCGQQQLSTETKFCSRCGMPLGLVSEVLAHGGYLPQLAELNKGKKKLLTRRNGIGFSVLWCLFFLIFAMMFGGVFRIRELGAIGAIFGIFGGFMWLLSSLIFLKGERRLPINPGMYNQAPQPAGVRPQGYEPQPQQMAPASEFWPPAGNWRDTNDLEPTSITESTTKLLERDGR